jgi:hypothetical protein
MIHVEGRESQDDGEICQNDFQTGELLERETVGCVCACDCVIPAERDIDGGAAAAPLGVRGGGGGGTGGGGALALSRTLVCPPP